ncbi:hypothetical protein A3D05_00795 [Candidatus Gottesmanbacteria bacterium RIFCSPHIGHO2_02_FULL_40_24]|uniref:Peptidase S11 D-alanyl-D-alanine carboxypeptidase A N-terminal domain-containing protein n=1 Tax=Candidatus Gottesmanbacteria bacterium RIFCSPHIGHO2_01_FULL_40_15 TaxID=1798376 RepID=A0A1F5Z6D7_9BACT|nr:MAG: hypothetical protein A2777_01195 [Candidatus Gottesmanbacteria bacterium RIFCSPHIGHO2_01_FULL_40_15]OGG18275.1 MAG: hypothetical protein A3D05_00795 [Candidatus Gottesmanbacteria bacterium RIFCSPHIGHO2_02_FULL_40_24]OGG22480.1 MAG: hypothetical protein A3B48_04350 [Candidatus Gottesmanbacteria bacterium RIFCSPLOWO2_01_FULL_40_10]OGG24834.1 MAG: hypothetical protein A3E42_01885 [Candidatus Gottesmanbacteria bacterium RIFCSPHIGHO2_12_FULL_40_13]OGG32183.1 MAG: hypothetical protein A3I80_0
MPKINNNSTYFVQKAIRILEFSLFAVLLSLFPSPNFYFRPQIPVQISHATDPQISLPPPPPLPVNGNLSPLPILSAQGVVVKDLESGVILYAKNEQKLLFPASTTKVMTALIILEKYNLDDVFTVNSVITDGRKMDLMAGEKLTVEALLQGTLIHSANDAAYVLADNYPGGVSAFVKAMNDKARQIGLRDTYFTNPVGFDDPHHYTTPLDLVRLAVYALNNKTFNKIVSTKAITVSDITFTYFHELTNVNQLLGRVAGIAGVKTGYTENAGEILISTVKKNGHNILFAVLKSHDRFGETVKLIDWVFYNFKWVEVAEVEI